MGENRDPCLYVDIHIETGDQNAVKNLLDDTITEIFQEKPEFKVQYGWDNAKLLLMLLASIIAAISHFYESPYISEQNRFFFVHALLFGYSVFIEKDVILRLTRTGSATQTILVRTLFPYTDSHYTVAIQHAGTKEKPVKVELYVGRYFDKEGYFHKDAFTKDIETILSRFQKKDKRQ
ncbi:hypothetical protein BBJ28_00005133 [Nothophytophthora sp. Chile5]|nr:hypothetical protein BBJ28_00005133 [Nothophytophthora sp. Chile5]